MMNESIFVEVLNSKLSVRVSTQSNDADSDMIFLHGAGTADLDRYTYLSTAVVNANRRAVRFNFSGHGDSTGYVQESSLKKRLVESCHIIDHLRLREPFTVLASSMGGYIALKLTEKYQINQLILFCPAVYTVDAFNVPFTNQFTSIIRQAYSWRNSDAFDIIRKYKGDLMIVVGSEDEIIPPEIIENLYNNAISCRSKQLIKIIGGPHALHTWLNKPEQERILNEFLSTLIKFLSH